ncbi:MAG: Gfo/Idh/MocA family oxidoreductase [Planctomycetes bacterium]|nr:Gfo/Idh/MocA family oxidoreductase [Planctomycetota bacterium]
MTGKGGLLGLAGAFSLQAPPSVFSDSNTQKRQKILIIGYGSIAKRHSEILESFQENYEVHLVTRQDIDYHISFKSLAEIKQLDAYEYYLICSETFKHREQLDYLNQNLRDKLILVEKPLFVTYEPIGELRNHIFVAYNLRYHPILQKIKDLVETERVLSVHIYCGQYLPHWRPGRDYRNCYSSIKAAGGGVLLDISHEIDYCQWLFGSLDSLQAINGKISPLEMDADDYVSLIAKTNQGTLLNLSMDCFSKVPKRDITIHLETKTIFADLISGRLQINDSEGQIEDEDYSDLERNSSYQAMHKSLLSGQKTSVCTYDEALNVNKTIDEIRASSETKKWC